MTTKQNNEKVVRIKIDEKLIKGSNVKLIEINGGNELRGPSVTCEVDGECFNVVPSSRSEASGHGERWEVSTLELIIKENVKDKVMNALNL